jgi:hypothetical protein
MQGQSVTLSYLARPEWQQWAQAERKKQGLSPLATKSSKSMKGLTNIPKPAAKKESVWKRRKRTVEIAPGYEAAAFLRIGSMSDCSYYPKDILTHFVKVWGDYCFFNSAIRSITRQPEKLELFHKVVVTVNPGSQSVVAPGIKGSDRWETIAKSLRGSGGKFGFFTPKTLADLRLDDSNVKFYRLRAIPTIIPHLETDKPVVVTQLRFRTLYDMAAWAKRYRVNCEIVGDLTSKQVKFLHDLGANVTVKKGVKKFAKLWTAKGDKRNVADRAGEASVYEFEDAWWRPALDQVKFEKESTGLTKYVCDRVHQGCSACGLCASLDGTQSGWENQLNVFDGEVFPLHENEAYSFDHLDLPKENPVMAEYFEQILEYVYERETGMLHLSLGKVDWIIDTVREYTEQDGQVDFCDGWNTHEYVSTLIAACAFWLLQSGMTPKKVEQYFDERGLSVAGIVDVEELASGESDFCDMFGVLV